jgi:hypothetical protein
MLFVVWLQMALGASQLTVTTDRPVVVFINLKPHPLQPGSTGLQVDFPNGKEGVQRVAIRNVLQELLWSGTVDVPEDTTVHAEFIQKRMEVGVPVRLSKPKLSEKGVYNVDGDWVRGQPGALVKTPAVPVPRRPPEEDAFLGAVTDAATTDGVGGVAREAEVIVRPAAGSGEGTLRLANRTTSWANLVVGDQSISFRGERTQELVLEAGPHRFEVRDFRDNPKWQGTVWVWPSETVELQFSETAAPSAPERPEAFEGGRVVEMDAP